MYKLLGIEIEIDGKCKEKLHSFMATLVNYYKRENEHFKIGDNNNTAGLFPGKDWEVPSAYASVCFSIRELV